jgi:hypothetical protein
MTARSADPIRLRAPCGSVPERASPAGCAPQRQTLVALGALSVIRTPRFLARRCMTGSLCRQSTLAVWQEINQFAVSNL